MAEMREGLTYVPGRSADTAKALIEAADRAGVERRHVRTQQRGYIVPDAVAEEHSKPPKRTTAKKAAAKKATAKKVEKPANSEEGTD